MKSAWFDLAVWSYLLAALLFLGHLAWGRWRALNAAALAVFAAGFAGNTVYIVQRWMAAGRPPFSNTFEAMVLFAWSIAFAFFLVYLFYRPGFLGAFCAFLAMAVLAYATLFGSEIRPLMPALQNSFWLTVHVILCFVGYAAFAIAFIAGLTELLGEKPPHRPAAVFMIAFFGASLAAAALLVRLVRGGTLKMELTWGSALLVLGGVAAAAALLTYPLLRLLEKLGVPGRVAAMKGLDTLIYRSVLFGFPLLGAGIIAGAVWADQAWGTYWSWDPKETASLLTWLVYSLYLHFRVMRGWKGPRATWVAVAGFYGVIFTFFGVNYLLSGLHSYA